MLALRELGYTALLLGVLVFVHELGHFLLAKWLGVKVLRFSIGFGPKIVAFTKGETEYRLAWIPFGGYVKMAGDVPGEELAPEDEKRGFLTQSPWRRALIIIAGPAFNLIFPVLAFFLIYVGTREVYSNQVGRVEPGLPAAAAGVQPGDRIVAIDNQPITTFEELKAQLQPTFEREIALTLERDGQRIEKRLTPARGVDENPIEKFPRGMIGISPAQRVPLIGAPPGSAAEQAGLKTFDRIVEVNGKPVAYELDLWAAVEASGTPVALKVKRGRPADEAAEPLAMSVPKQSGEGYAALGAESSDLYVSAVEKDSPAEKAGLKVGDKLLAFNDKPLKGAQVYSLALGEADTKPFKLTWRSGQDEKSAQLKRIERETKDELGQKFKMLDAGVRLGGIKEGDEKVLMTKVTLGPWEAFVVACKKVPDVIAKTAIGLGQLFTGKMGFENLGGPIMVHKLASKTVDFGFEYFLNLMAAISVSLGLINLVPIPILDGFHLLAAFWEGIRRRPIPVRAREIANMVGLVMLIMLMVLVFRNDLRR